MQKQLQQLITIFSGSILDCIAVLTETPELCLSLWQQLEATQILPTVQTNTTKLGIQVRRILISSSLSPHPYLLISHPYLLSYLGVFRFNPLI